MLVTTQDDWGGGMFRGRRAPENAVFDLVNGFVSDEGEVFKRGGSVYKNNGALGGNAEGLAVGDLAVGVRTMFWRPGNFYILDPTDDATALNLSSAWAGVGMFPKSFTRAVGLGGLAAFVSDTPGTVALLYGGATKPVYSGGTAAVTAGSRTVTGTGTSWLTNAEPGMIITAGIPGGGLVDVVSTNTSIRLRDPWPGATAAAGVYSLWSALPAFQPSPVPSSLVGAEWGVAAVGTPARLIQTVGNRAYFSPPGAPLMHTDGDYHELPGGARITGADSIQDTLVLFTTAGVWAVSNMNLDPLDDFGNDQHTVAQINKDVVLWGQPGMAAWNGALLVPAVDDVFLLPLDGQPVPVSSAIRPLYRSYVAAGYQPGPATVHRGHYFLPVLNGSTVVDVLVCRLDRGSAWSRLSGGAAGCAYAQRVGATARQPALFGLSTVRVTDLTGIFTPTDANRLDNGGSAPAFSMTTRDYDTGPGVKGGLLRHARLEYDLVAPSSTATIAVASAKGAENAAFTVHPEGAPEADGGVKTWMLNTFGERVRLRFESADATATLRIRRLEAHMEPSQRP